MPRAAITRSLTSVEMGFDDEKTRVDVSMGLMTRVREENAELRLRVSNLEQALSKAETRVQTRGKGRWEDEEEKDLEEDAEHRKAQNETKQLSNRGQALERELIFTQKALRQKEQELAVAKTNIRNLAASVRTIAATPSGSSTPANLTFDDRTNDQRNLEGLDLSISVLGDYTALRDSAGRGFDTDILDEIEHFRSQIEEVEARMEFQRVEDGIRVRAMEAALRLKERELAEAATRLCDADESKARDYKKAANTISSAIEGDSSITAAHRSELLFVQLAALKRHKEDLEEEVRRWSQFSETLIGDLDECQAQMTSMRSLLPQRQKQSLHQQNAADDTKDKMYIQDLECRVARCNEHIARQHAELQQERVNRRIAEQAVDGLNSTIFEQDDVTIQESDATNVAAMTPYMPGLILPETTEGEKAQLQLHGASLEKVAIRSQEHWTDKNVETQPELGARALANVLKEHRRETEDQIVKLETHVEDARQAERQLNRSSFKMPKEAIDRQYGVEALGREQEAMEELTKVVRERAETILLLETQLSESDKACRELKEARKALQDEVTGLQAILQQTAEVKLNLEIELEAKDSVSSAKERELRAKLQKSLDVVDDLKRKLESRNQEFWDLKEELAQLQEESEDKEEMLMELERVRENMQSVDAERREAVEAQQIATMQVEASRIARKEHDKLVHELHEDINEKKRHTHVLEEKLCEIKVELQDAKVQIQEVLVKLNESCRRAQDREEKLREASAEGDASRERCAALEEELLNLRKELANNKKGYRQGAEMEDITLLQEKIQSLEAELTVKAEEAEDADDRVRKAQTHTHLILSTNLADYMSASQKLMLMKQNKKLSSRITSLEAKVVHAKAATPPPIAKEGLVSRGVASLMKPCQHATYAKDAERTEMPFAFTSRKRGSPDNDPENGHADDTSSNSTRQQKDGVTREKAIPTSTRPVYAPPPSKSGAEVRTSSFSNPSSLGFSPVRHGQDASERKCIDFTNYTTKNLSPKKASSDVAAKLAQGNDSLVEIVSSKIVDRTNRPVKATRSRNGSVVGSVKGANEFGLQGPHFIT